MRASVARKLAELLTVAASILRVFSDSKPKSGYVSPETAVARKIESAAREVNDLGTRLH